MPKKTLLDKAKESSSSGHRDNGHTVTNETIMLAIALLREEVTYAQAAKALGFKSTGYVGAWMAKHLKEALRQDLIQINEKAL